MSFRRGNVVLAAFPYVEQARTRRRPALVVSDGEIGPERLLWVLMITGATKSTWPSDIDVGADFARMGLIAPSVVRCGKIAAIEASKAQVVGSLPADRLALVDAAMATILGLDAHTANP